MLLRKKRGKWKAGALVDLLVDAREFYPAIEKALAEAKKQVLLECYMLSSDSSGQRILRLLVQAARRGVKVWVVLDAVGSRKLVQKDRELLRAAGVKLQIYQAFDFFHPMRFFFRTHRRLLLIDGRVGFIGGFGFSDDWLCDDDPGRPWHEFAWRIRGLPLKEIFWHFENNWKEEKPLALPEVLRNQPLVEENVKYQLLQKLKKRPLRLHRVLRKLCNQASERVWVASAYFVPPLRLQRALARAASRGIDVRLMLAGHRSDHRSVFYAGRRAYAALLKGGVHIFETRQRMMHAKALIVDGEISILGSSNLDSWSLRRNREFDLMLSSQSVCQQLENAMKGIQEGSQRLSFEAWKSRPLWDRFLEYFFGLGEDYL